MSETANITGEIIIARNYYYQLIEFRRIVTNLTRCEHGRIQEDSCLQCPDGISPSKAGIQLGYSIDGNYRITIPIRSKMNDPVHWFVLNE